MELRTIWMGERTKKFPDRWSISCHSDDSGQEDFLSLHRQGVIIFNIVLIAAYALLCILTKIKDSDGSAYDRNVGRTFGKCSIFI